MKSFFQKQHRLIFYCSWLLMTLVQSASTGLLADEAYYWVYSRFPAWGYFDHPPMTALLIKWGYALFQNELGVRLLCALLSVFNIAITESLTDRKNPFLFYTIVLSIGTLQIAGFLAVPDTPLLFFTALFFYCYRYFLKNINWRGSFFLGLSIALLFYAKYHGLLVVFFVIISNLKLLRYRQSWLAGLVALILFAPHLLWQWENNWISFRFHLFENVINPYRFSNVTDYLLGQLMVAGPFAGLILLPAAFLYKTKQSFEKALKFTLFGIYFVFLVSSFRGAVEPNWTFPLLIPLVVLSYQFLNAKTSWIKPFRIIAFVSLLLIMALRIYLVVDIGPDNSIKKRFQHNKDWVIALAEKTKNRPVVFFNTYQQPSFFWFYSGGISHSLNSWTSRRSNYNFWPIENKLLGQIVVVAENDKNPSTEDSLKTNRGWVYLRTDSLFASFGQIKIIPEKNKIEAVSNQYFLLGCKSETPLLYSNFLHQHPLLRTELLAGIFKGKELIKEINTGIKVQQFIDATAFEVLVNLNDIPPGNYIFRFGIKSADYPPTQNSDNITLIIR